MFCGLAVVLMPPNRCYMKCRFILLNSNQSDKQKNKKKKSDGNFKRKR